MAKPYQYHEEYSKLPATSMQAVAIGETYYYTGKECARGHLSARYASSGNCVQCIAEKRGKIQIKRGKSTTRSAENIKRAHDALTSGKTEYESTKPCPHGHYTRYVTTNNCVKCSNASMQKRKKEYKWRRLKEQYGLTKEQYQQMLSKQNNKCEICQTSLTEKNTHVDHCHKTGAVRSLLCSRCNQGIGLFDEDLERLNRVIAYIKEHNHG